MYEKFDIKEINLMKHFDINDLHKSEKAFDAAMQDFKELYIKTGTPIRYYANLEEFETDYLQ
jgi:hypothetical protein